VPSISHRCRSLQGKKNAFFSRRRPPSAKGRRKEKDGGASLLPRRSCSARNEPSKAAAEKTPERKKEEKKKSATIDLNFTGVLSSPALTPLSRPRLEEGGKKRKTREASCHGSAPKRRHQSPPRPVLMRKKGREKKKGRKLHVKNMAPHRRC